MIMLICIKNNLTNYYIYLMKYLKKFNESLELNELKNFCDLYLAYLYDDDFKLSFDNNDDFINVNIDKGIDNFKYEDVKDIFIPFLTILSEKYEVEEVVFIYNSDYKIVELINIIKDSFTPNNDLMTLMIRIENN